MKRLILTALAVSMTGCGVILPDVMIVGSEQGIRAYNDGQSSLIAQAKTQHKNQDQPYWSTRKVQSGYSFWERLSRGLIATSKQEEVTNVE